MVGDCPPHFLQLTFNCCNVSIFSPGFGQGLTGLFSHGEDCKERLLISLMKSIFAHVPSSGLARLSGALDPGKENCCLLLSPQPAG